MVGDSGEQSSSVNRSPLHRLSSLRTSDDKQKEETQKSDFSQQRVRLRQAATSNSALQNLARNSNQKVSRRPRSHDIMKTTLREESSMASSSQKQSSVFQDKVSSVLPQPSQAIILFCMQNARSDIALRILQRMAHKRDDFAQFYANLDSEQIADLAVSLKKFLNSIVKNISDPEKIREISSQFGTEQAHKRCIGFKADFFAVLADALTTECVFLDGAAHQPTETIEAWAALAGLMFSHVRDGYYQQVRRTRRTLQHFGSNSVQSSQSDRSFDDLDSTNAKRNLFYQTEKSESFSEPLHSRGESKTVPGPSQR